MKTFVRIILVIAVIMSTTTVCRAQGLTFTTIRATLSTIDKNGAWSTLTSGDNFTLRIISNDGIIATITEADLYGPLGIQFEFIVPTSTTIELFLENHYGYTTMFYMKSALTKNGYVAAPKVTTPLNPEIHELEIYSVYTADVTDIHALSIVASNPDLTYSATVAQGGKIGNLFGIQLSIFALQISSGHRPLLNNATRID